MRRSWLISSGGAAAAFMIAVIGFLLLQDYSDYKPEFAAAARDLTGRKVEINGDIRLRMGLTPSLVMHDVTLADAEGAPRPIMATFRRFEVAVDLFSLLGGTVRVKRLSLIGGDMNLEIDEQGQGNWLLAADTGVSGGADEGVVLPLNRFRILDTKVTFRDRRSGRVERFDVSRFQGRVAGAADAMIIELDAMFRGQALTANGTVGAEIYRAKPPTMLPVDIQVRIAGATATATGKIGVPLVGGGTDLAFEIDGTGTQDLARLIGETLPDIGSYRAEGRLRAGVGHWTGAGVTIQLGAWRMTGSARLDTVGKKPFVTANVVTSPIDFDALGPRVPVMRGDGKRRWVFGGEPLPVDLIPDLEGAATVKSTAVTVEGLRFTDVSLTALLEDRALMIRNMRSRLLDGEARGDLVVNTRRRPPSIGGRIVLRDTDVGSLLNHLAITDSVTGRGDVMIRLRGRGNSLRAIASTAKGDVEVVVGKGHIKGGYVDLLGADILGSIAPWAERIEDSSVNCMVGLFRIAGGVATSEGVLLDTNRVTIAGKGQIDLRTETFDMNLSPRPKDPSLLSLAVPIDLTGPLTDPLLTPNELSVAKNVASAVAGGLINPLIVLVPLVSPGTGDTNACVAALEKGVDREKRAKSLPKYDDRPFIHRSIEDVSREIGQGITDLFSE